MTEKDIHPIRVDNMRPKGRINSNPDNKAVRCFFFEKYPLFALYNSIYLKDIGGFSFQAHKGEAGGELAAGQLSRSLCDCSIMPARHYRAVTTPTVVVRPLKRHFLII